MEKRPPGGGSRSSHFNMFYRICIAPGDGGFLQGPSAPSYPLCEGLLRDGSPCTHHAGAPGDDLCGTVVPAPTCRRSARAWLCHARHPGTFSRGKVPKARQGCALWNPPVRGRPLFALAYASRGNFNTQDRFPFEMVENRSFPLVSSRKHRFSTNPKGNRSRVWLQPYRGGPGAGGRGPLGGPGEVPGESLVTFFSQESHPGAGRSALQGR